MSTVLDRKRKRLKQAMGSRVKTSKWGHGATSLITASHIDTIRYDRRV